MTYPIAVILGDQPWEESRRWIQNDPGFTVFLALVVPFVAGILAAKLDLKPLRRFTKVKRVVSMAVFVLLIGLGLRVAVLDLNGQMSSPIRYESPLPVLVHETQLRNQVRDAVALVETATGDERAARKVELAAVIKSAREVYLARWPRIDSLSSLIAFGSPAAFVAFGLNAFVALFAAVLFWYCWLLVQFRNDWRATAYDWMLLTVGLMMVWFPLRLYSEWYLHFFSLQIAEYPIFQFLVVVALLAYLFVAFRVAARLSIKIFAAVATGLIGLLTTLGKLAPEWIEELAWALEGWDFQLYVALLLLIVLALSAMIWSLVDEGLKPAPAPAAGRRAGGARRVRAGTG
ncbi:MAG TPA: hypothetical protein VHG35_15390 [Gemmatimonadales bacterium]|nr:hypothetical protein [Gemmatimonadales bacterium]